MYKIDAKKMIRDFGGFTKTARLLNNAGVSITPNAVDKWRRTERVPVTHVCSLAMIAKDRKQRFDLYDYII